MLPLLLLLLLLLLGLLDIQRLAPGIMRTERPPVDQQVAVPGRSRVMKFASISFGLIRAVIKDQPTSVRSGRRSAAGVSQH